MLDLLPEPMRSVGPNLGAVADDGEGAGKAEAIPPIPLAADLVGCAREEPVCLAPILRVQLHLLGYRQLEELLAHCLHVTHRLLGDAMVDHLQHLPPTYFSLGDCIAMYMWIY